MTLRIELSIIPFGDESKKKVIETINISNISFSEPMPNTYDKDMNKYVIEHNEYKNYSDDNLRIYHHRKDGALVLAKKVLNKLTNSGK